MNRRHLAVLSTIAVLNACNCGAPIVPLADSGTGGGSTGNGGGGTSFDGGGGGTSASGGGSGGGTSATGGGNTGGGQATGGGSGGGTADGGCFEQPVGFFGGAPWADGGCPTDGCGAGQVCVVGVGEGGNTYGCSPVPAECSGNPSCGCMGCICSLGCIGPRDDGGTLMCNNGTVSRRSYKDDVHYIDDGERKDLARQALSMQLARYRYKAEPTQSKLHLGFIIDDQPRSSPAVHGDQTTVDEYGYTSMLLATVQQQQAEIAELKRRIEQLERAKR
jgi:hypothetical protein